MFEVDVNNVMEQEKKETDHLWFRVLMCKIKKNSEEQFQDEGSYERQDTRNTKFAKTNQGFPYWDLHNHSINFSPPAQRGSQTILTISEYGCRTNSHWFVNFNSNLWFCKMYDIVFLLMIILFEYGLIYIHIVFQVHLFFSIHSETLQQS